MAKIRHIAIKAEDPAKTAKFYVEAFGMKEVGRIDYTSPVGYHLTDGDVALTIFPVGPGKTAGIDHIGFQIDSYEENERRLKTAKAKRRVDPEKGKRYGAGKRIAGPEDKIDGPDGVLIDIALNGWPGTAGNTATATEMKGRGMD